MLAGAFLCHILANSFKIIQLAALHQHWTSNLVKIAFSVFVNGQGPINEISGPLLEAYAYSHHSHPQKAEVSRSLLLPLLLCYHHTKSNIIVTCAILSVFLTITPEKCTLTLKNSTWAKK